MNITEIKKAIEPEIIDRKMFLVDIGIKKDNVIEITIEREEGLITLDDCVSLSRFFETQFDREKEDYELTVTSAGLDRPFKVLGQFKKAIGKKVEVMLKGGKKIIGTLTNANENEITIDYSSLEKIEGAKKKQLIQHEDKFPMEDVNSTTYFIEFE